MLQHLFNYKLGMRVTYLSHACWIRCIIQSLKEVTKDYLQIRTMTFYRFINNNDIISMLDVFFHELINYQDLQSNDILLFYLSITILI